MAAEVPSELFVVIGDAISSFNPVYGQDMTQRRQAKAGQGTQGEGPEGVKHGEYWPSSESVAVVSIFETDDHGALMEIGFT